MKRAVETSSTVMKSPLMCGSMSVSQSLWDTPELHYSLLSVKIDLKSQFRFFYDKHYGVQSSREHLQNKECAIFMLNISEIYMSRFNQRMNRLIQGTKGEIGINEKGKREVGVLTIIIGCLISAASSALFS